MAGRIPQPFIDELLARADIVGLIDGYVPLKPKGREFVACCPFHQEKTPSFTVSPAKQFYHCFGCGAHGTALGFLVDYERLDFVAAVELLAQRAGMEVPREEDPAQPREDFTSLYAALDEARQFYQECLRKSPQAIAYLKGRGLTGETARDFALGYAPPDWDALTVHLGGRFDAGVLEKAGLTLAKRTGGEYDRFRNRILFPIRDRSGRVIGFGARALGDELPKYLNSPETPVFSKGRNLYGWHEARKAMAQLGRVLVVEGYMDAVALVQAGVAHVVATLGTATTAEHIRQMYGAVSEIQFCFDGDRAGREAAWRAAQQLLPLFQDGRDARFVFLPAGEDPDSLIRKQGREIFEQVVSQSVPFADYLFSRLREGLDMSAAAGRAQLAQRAKPLLSRLPQGVFSALMQQRLSQEVGVEVSLEGQARRPGFKKAAAWPTRKVSGLIGKAAGLLLQTPALVGEVPPAERWRALDEKGVPLLAGLVDLLRAQPTLSSAALAERFRDTPYAEVVLKLLQWEPLPSPDPIREFRDALQRLEARLTTQRLAFLQQKLKTEGLSADEKEEYRSLLKGRD